MQERRDPVSEIEKLLDELESFAEKSPWYLPNKIAIRDEDFFRITQRVRELLPSELAEARSTLEKRDLILKNAQEEHKRIIDAAEKRLDDLTSQDQVVVAARQHAERLIEKAKLEAESVRRDALLYTAELLADMEKQFGQTLLSVQNGRKYLETELNKQVSENLAAVTSVPGSPEEKPQDTANAGV
jgi:cell division septum initiation protein DivIVA